MSRNDVYDIGYEKQNKLAVFVCNRLSRLGGKNTLQITIRLLPIKFAKSLERHEILVPSALEHASRRRAYEIHPTLFHLLDLGADADLALALGADDDARAVNGLERRFRATLLQLGLDDAEFFDRRVVEDGGGGGAVGCRVEGHVGIVCGGHFLLADGGVVVG